MEEELIETRDKVTKQIFKNIFDEIDRLEELLKSIEDWKDKIDIMLKLSEKYKSAYYGWADFPELCKDLPEKQEIFRQLNKNHLWKSVYYREKALNILTEHRLIEVNSYLFMDVDLKYKYFVDLDYNYNYNDEEEGLYFDIYGESSKDKINIVINDLKYANRGVYNRLRYLEKEKNYEELFVWYEIWGDLYLAIQLLLMMAGEGLTDNAKLSLNCYKKSRENLLMFSEQQTFYDGIYGMPYQINFFDNLLKKNGFHGYDRRSVHKMEFIERNILHKGSQDYFEYRDFSKLDFLPSKEKLEKKLRDLLEEYPFLGVNTNFKEWKTAIEYFHGLLLYNYKQRYLNTYVNKWEREGDMQKWLQREIDRHLIISQNEPSFTSGREIKMGGGNCDHYYKNIPICDKWKRDSNASSYPIKISEFISKLYDHNKAQFHSYAQEVKLGIVVVVDSRSVTRENKSPDIADNCYRFSVNKVSEDAAICLVIFVLQISDIPPSERK